MKAIILSAGLGTRLRPLTDKVPKVMLPVRGRPLLEHHLANLNRCGITDIGINLHYLPQVVSDHIGDGKRFGVSVHYSHEKTLLGTSGALIPFKAWLGTDPFIVIYGDNFFQMDLRPVMQQFSDFDPILGLICLQKVSSIQGKGLVTVDCRNNITSFLEKPRGRVDGEQLINAGIYIFSQQIFCHIPSAGFSDFGYDVFPRLLRLEKPSLRGYIIKEPLIDIGTKENYTKANLQSDSL